jgi:hypothetical protein
MLQMMTVQQPTLHSNPRTDSHASGAFFRLTELLSELQLEIALRLCGTTAVLNLSLVNKNLHSVAQEAMAKQLIIPSNSILECLMMLTRDPHLMAMVNPVDLGEYLRHHALCFCSGSVELERKTRKILRDMIPDWAALQAYKTTQ